MLYLGVDGGGTRTAFILVNHKGEIKAYSNMESCHYVQRGLDKFSSVIREGIESVCKKSGSKISDINYSFLGLPGYGEDPEGVSTMEEIVKDTLGTKNFHCGNDFEAGWAGALACRPGINLVAGTGAIGFGRDGEGETARASGWGYFCGDEGSAYWLGKKLISLFGKEADRREDRTAIYEIVRNKFDLDRNLDLVTVVREELEMKRDKIAGLAKLLYEAAEKGDRKAVELYKEAAYEHSLIVKALVRKLSFSNEKNIPTSYTGGVFKAGNYIIEPLREFLQDENVELISPKLTPVVGAALFAMKLDENINNYEKIVDNLQNEEKVKIE